ncbi:helix-turn-helix transcriptional regulator [Caldovatus aquaticus]|uniref:LuxR family transcriptional regulator n=1 Tax=Caldovatus aquaticus TaxID=2865671 RepID=A0ABS7F433_9PROT|nr:LuxR family transcriptional regulator [Caldovatus aquaticus]MBW8270378.1 LuxR family transcriptional regulator [Caldovatus aquaticus]
MGLPLLDMLERVGAARSAGAVWSEAVAGFAAIGVAWCHHAYAPPAWAAPGTPARLRLTTLPPSWMAHYEASGFLRMDASRRHCARAVTPLPVGEEFARALGDADWARMCAEAAAVAGIGCGLAVPLRPAPGTAHGGFTLLTRLRGPAFAAWRRAHERSAALVAHAVAQRILEVTEALAPVTAVPRLSPRERECLSWLAAGLRNDRIAERMGIARATVDLHLARARRKLGAATREQALAKALSFGLIEP